MNKLFDWLEDEPSGARLWKFLVLAVVVGLLYATLLGLTGLELPSNETLERRIVEQPMMVLLFVPFLAALEEFFFRLPLAIAVEMKTPQITIVLAVIVLSTIFGYAHGSWTNIAMQGVLGVLFSIVFLRCGGMNQKYGKAFFSSTFVHVAYNYVAIGLAMVEV